MDGWASSLVESLLMFVITVHVGCSCYVLYYYYSNELIIASNCCVLLWTFYSLSELQAYSGFTNATAVYTLTMHLLCTYLDWNLFPPGDGQGIQAFFCDISYLAFLIQNLSQFQLLYTLLATVTLISTKPPKYLVSKQINESTTLILNSGYLNLKQPCKNGTKQNHSYYMAWSLEPVGGTWP